MNPFVERANVLTNLKNEFFLPKSGICIRHNDIDRQLETVIFIHGLAGSSSAWDATIAQWHGRQNILQIDLRGHGRSRRYHTLDDYQISRITEDVVELIKTLQIKQATLIAHSFGCLVALTCALHKDIALKRLILISPGYHQPRPILAACVQMMIKAGTFFTRCFNKVDKAGDRVDYAKFKIHSDYSPPRLVADIKNTGLLVYLRCIYWVLMADVQELITKISYPVCLIHGKNDSVFPLRHAYSMNEKLQNSLLQVINDANHVPLFSHAELLYQHISRFIDNNDG